MSNYRGHTGPNFSQYLSDLNTLSPPDNQFGEDNDFSNDLAMYTNTDFTNLDMPGLGEDDTFNFDLPLDSATHENVKYEELLGAPVTSTDFVPGEQTSETLSQPQTQPFYTTYNAPIQPAPSAGFPNTDSIAQSTSPAESRRPKTGSSQTVDHVSAEERSRLAAEEDKRRRNTAASARFRVKKKQREQALEKTLKETQEKNSKLDARISQLEMENKWLKDLITEKNGLSSKEEIAAAYEKHRKESEERDLKTEPGHTTGVGTD